MILVTGATGHIGNVLVRNLTKSGAQVRALVFPGDDLTPIRGLNVDTVEGDILDYDSLLRAMTGVQDVYHLAGIISIMPGKNEGVQKVNVHGTQNVIKTARQAGIRRLVYTSSIHALHRAPHGITIDESIPFDPIHAVSAYDQSKAYASLAVMEAARQDLDAVVVCPTGVIGPYDFRRSEMGQVILDAMQKKPQFIVEGAYDFVDVRDIAQGLIMAHKQGQRGESYILSGEQITVSALVTMVQKISGISSSLLEIPMGMARFISQFMPAYYRLSRTKPRFTPYALETLLSNSIFSNAKAQRDLGFTPRSLQVSVADTIKWFLENSHLLPGQEHSIQSISAQ